jgi:PKD domain
MRTAFLIVLFPILALVLPVNADAVIHPATVLEGPANNIVDVDGSAMASDGSGGIIFRKQVEGVTHVFAIPFRNGSWGEPLEVDTEDPYGASQPAIAAGDGGRLLVVWIQPRNISAHDVAEYALMSASLQPGANAFGQAITIDPSVGEPDTGDVSGVEPKLAMAPDGAAYVVYRVTTDDCGVGDENSPEEFKCRPGSSDKVVDVRVARFDFLTWSSLGTINRAPQLAMRAPTSSNAPAIGIDVDGNGIVAWQEPDASGTARIWVRRLFGTIKGTVLQAGPESVGGRPVTSDAEAPAIADSRFGEARIAFLIKGASGSAIPTTQLYDDSIFSEFDPHGSALQGAQPVAGAIATNLGPPSAALDPTGEFRLAWSQGGAVRELAGSNQAGGTPVQVGVASGPVQTTINPAGGGTAAWSTTVGGLPVVEAHEDYTDGAYQVAQLAGDVPGAVSGLSLSGSGEGDALIGWMQGPPGHSVVVGDFVQAPPAPFILSAPNGWVRARDASVEWEPTTDAVAPVTYSIYVDGRSFLSGLTATHANLSSAVLGDGVHEVQVLATDSAGQRTMSAKSPLKIGAEPPTVGIALIDHRHGVRVTVREKAPGVDGAATKIAFGDGRHANGRATVSHVYARPGLYAITAQVRDKIGNHSTVYLRVRVR